MKKFTWLIAAVLPLALAFSCQKEVTTTAADRNVTMHTPGGGGGCSQTVPSGFVQVSYPNGTPVAGQQTTVRVCVPCGSMTEANILLNGTVVGTATASPGVSCLDITFTPSASSDCTDPNNQYKLDIKYNNSGGSTCSSTTWPDAPYCNPGVVAQASTICIPVSATTCDPANPLTLTGTVNSITDSAGLGIRSIIDVTYCVTSCKNITGVKVQGGATAGGNVGAYLISYSDHSLVTTAGGITYPHQLNNNWVLSWTTDLTAGTTKCFNFVYSRSLVTDCSDITGDWSAVAAGVTSATKAPLNACPN